MREPIVLPVDTPEAWPYELRRAAQRADPALREVLRAAYAELRHAREALDWATGPDLERALEAVLAAEARWRRLRGVAAWLR